jgi:non-homologous end joining protein Ku
MEGKKRDLALKQLKDEFMPILEEIRNKLAPVETFTSEAKTTMEEQARAAHFNALATAHSDYETYRDDGSILKWIETKPKYMQAPLLQTYQGGATEDVIDLISDFKKENNIQPPSNVVDVKSARKAAITAPVTRKAAVAAHMKVADDYEGAFDEALHKGG